MIYLEFPLNQYTWDIVIGENNEDAVVEYEGSSVFVVEYPSQENVDKAIVRFDGNVQFKDVTTKYSALQTA
jgi:hypothetical protein